MIYYTPVHPLDEQNPDLGSGLTAAAPHSETAPQCGKTLAPYGVERSVA